MNPTELALGQAYFWVCAAVAIAGAVTTVVAKNPIRGAMGLLVMILSIAGLYLALHAQFLAAIQLIVYAGAIVVLFIFVIMLLGPDVSAPRDNRGRLPRIVSASAFATAGLGAMLLLLRTAPPLSSGKLLPAAPTDFGNVESFGRILFTDALVPFELSSALLMVAVIGAVAVARGHHKSDSRERRAAADSASRTSDLSEPKATPSAGVTATKTANPTKVHAYEVAS